MRPSFVVLIRTELDDENVTVPGDFGVTLQWIDSPYLGSMDVNVSSE